MAGWLNAKNTHINKTAEQGISEADEVVMLPPPKRIDKMIFEDLTEKDFRLIGEMIPAALTFPDMKESLISIKDKYDLNDEDAVTAFFIAQECKKHYKDIDNVISRRTKGLLKERDKLGLVT